MPDDMQILLTKYPRDDWAAHPGFHEKTRHWMAAHRMFKQVAGSIVRNCESYLDNKMDPIAFGDTVAYRGTRLVNNLHGHHHWEDHSFFPELSAADPRFDRGLGILEKDHIDLDAVLNGFVGSGNRALKLIQLDEIDAQSAVDDMYQHAKGISALLERHLTDEEELAVPIILEHRLRG